MIVHWKNNLDHLYCLFQHKKENTDHFLFKLFVIFFILNFICFWFALSTAFPQYLSGDKSTEYMLMSIPVGIMGATFDTISMFITLWLIKCAIRTSNTFNFLAYISIDFFIALLATFWILFAFVASGWIVNLIIDNPETFNQRSALYEGRIEQIFEHPLYISSLKNIYFGLLMGASAFIPTLIHIYMAGYSCFKYFKSLLIKTH
ncbi:MAG: hypothetical protein ACSHWT_09250 [Glaciecola sp.]|jgi:hypothetical protein